MDTSRLTLQDAVGEKKQKAVQDAKDMYKQVVRNCERTNTIVPPYDFIELIGKGAFGRVYKCRERSTGDLVAIKIVNTDDVDYSSHVLDKDDTIRDFRKEVEILQQLKDSNAKNVNMIHSAFDLQQQLWIVSDYCTGGSIRTLMRAQPANQPGLDEQYIIPIARELALAMKCVHDIGVIHRDIKCTNVYVTEDGEIQLGDFGIVGVMDDGVAKRRTMIGTPHYMPLEMHISGGGNQVAEAYGTEVDVWSFGCSVYEMATGVPPNALKSQGTLNVVLLNAPRLEGGNHSQELRDFVSFCLDSDPKARPTAEEVLKHPYIANTQRSHPSRKLVELIHRFKMWEYGGGVRHSLFMAGGAAPVFGGDEQDEAIEGNLNEDWNFSTSDSFNADFEKRYSRMSIAPDPDGSHDSSLAGGALPPIVTDLTPWQRLEQQHKELSASRGERSLDRIFSAASEPYDLHTPVDDAPISDLPFRNLNDSAPTRESQIIIDLDSAGEVHASPPSLNFDFGDMPTLKPRDLQHDEHEYESAMTAEQGEKRATLEWKFPTLTLPPAQAQKRATMDWTFAQAEPAEPDDPDMHMRLPSPGDDTGLAPSYRPTLKHTMTAPVGQIARSIQPTLDTHPASASPIRESIMSMVDLDLGISDATELDRPLTASSTTSSTMLDMTSGNPFDLEEDPAQNGIDRSRFSHHKQWQSEGGQRSRNSRRSVPLHDRGSSLSSGESEQDRPSITDDDVFNYEYNSRPSSSARPTLNGNLVNSSVDTSQWPDFSPDHGYDRVQEYPNGHDDATRQRHELEASHRLGNQTNGHAMQSYGTQEELPHIEFPPLIPPHPNALAEDAQNDVVLSEMNRLLDDLDLSLSATITTLQQYGSFSDDETAWETEIDSSAHTTEGEEGF